ncbi:MAG: hypothetical protein P1U35_13550 [Cycloclasticus sp.]|nr:hypothetical protein [Cycloclasticus sp.]
MARRKQLKGVAGSLVQWCMSRNFDYQGYWAIGQLYAHAQAMGVNELIVNPIDKSMKPKPVNEKFIGAFEAFSNILNKTLKANEIPSSWIQDIRLVLQFNQEYQHKYHYWGSALGKPFICSVEITTDLGKKFKVENGCNIWVHNPKRESRRNGF